MIWEVDEDCDGSVNYKEFLATWQRCREDKAGAWLHQGAASFNAGRGCRMLKYISPHEPLSGYLDCEVLTKCHLPVPLNPPQAPSPGGCTMWCCSCCTTAAAAGG